MLQAVHKRLRWERRPLGPALALLAGPMGRRLRRLLRRSPCEVSHPRLPGVITLCASGLLSARATRHRTLHRHSERDRSGDRLSSRGPDRRTKKREISSGETYSAACYNLADLDDIGGGPPRADRDAHLCQVARWSRAASIDDDGNLGRGVSRIVQSMGLGVGLNGGAAACPRAIEID